MAKLPVSEAQDKRRRARKSVGDFHFRYHKRWHSDALRGMSDLNPEQRGVYNTLIDLQYERKGALENDPAWLARVCNCPLRTFKRIRDELLAKGRILETECGGWLYDQRCVEELVMAGVMKADLSDLGKASAQARAERAPKRIQDAAKRAAEATANGWRRAKV